jgi:hypothetical protein
MSGERWAALYSSYDPLSMNFFGMLEVWKIRRQGTAMQFDLPLARKKSLTASPGPRERSVAVQIFAAHFLETLLVFTAAFVVRAEIVPAVLD